MYPQNGEAGDEQILRCRVPGCGRTFEKRYLLKQHVREHDDRPYRCPRRSCDKSFATPNEQWSHIAIHRINDMRIMPNIPGFAPPTVSASTAPGAVPDAPQFTEQEEVKSDGKPEGDADGSGDGDNAGNIGDADRPVQGDRDEGQWEALPKGEEFDEFMKPVVPGEAQGEAPTTEDDNRMEEDTT